MAKYIEIKQLYEYCQKIGVHAEISPLFDGFCIRFKNGGDVIQHLGSYGSKCGYVEPAIGSKLDYTGISLKNAESLVRIYKDKLNGESLTDVYSPGSESDWEEIDIYCSTNNLENATIHSDNPFVIENGVLVRYEGEGGDVVIPDGVTSIGNSAFCGCTNLTAIIIPNSVTSIGDSAFQYCTSLTSLTIPEGVTSIGMATFSGCLSLTSITIPDSVTNIGDWAFNECISLTSITIPDSVTNIGDGAFMKCISLTSITIPNSATNIGEGAFRLCISLTSVTIGNSVTSISKRAFYECTSLTDVYYSGSKSDWQKIKINTSGNEALATATIHSDNPFVIENGVLVRYEGEGGDVVIPDSVTNIGDLAFSGCTSLASITIPDSVTRIGYMAFYGCDSLTSVTIPDSVTSIGFSAFEDCTNLTDVYYSGSESDWDKIEIDYPTDNLEKATIHFNS